MSGLACCGWSCEIALRFEWSVGRSLSVSGVFRIEFSEVEWLEPDGFKFTILTGKTLEFSRTKDDRDADPAIGSEGSG